MSVTRVSRKLKTFYSSEMSVTRVSRKLKTFYSSEMSVTRVSRKLDKFYSSEICVTRVISIKITKNLFSQKLNLFFKTFKPPIDFRQSEYSKYDIIMQSKEIHYPLINSTQTHKLKDL